MQGLGNVSNRLKTSVQLLPNCPGVNSDVLSTVTKIGQLADQLSQNFGILPPVAFMLNQISRLMTNVKTQSRLNNGKCGNRGNRGECGLPRLWRV